MKKIVLRITLIILVVIFSSWLIIALLPRPKNYASNNPFLIDSSSMPLLIAHGGGNREFPDNTLEAFYHAYSIDSNVMMETDVSITKDGYIILSHDTSLNRKTNVQGPIIDHNYVDLLLEEVDFAYENKNGELIKYKNYLDSYVRPTDVSYPEGINPRHETKFLVTTLRELICSFPNNYINVEIKQSGKIGLKALVAVIELMDELDEEYNTYSRIVLASFHQEIYIELQKYQKEKYPNLMFSPATKSATSFFILQALGLDIFYKDKITVFQLPTKQYGINLASKSLIRRAHKHNIAVHYWTIDDEQTMKLLIKNGADGIMTNIPSLLKEVYEEQKTS